MNGCCVRAGRAAHPLDQHQFFLRSPDSVVGKYLKMFTLLPLSRIDAVLAEHAVRPIPASLQQHQS